MIRKSKKGKKEDSGGEGGKGEGGERNLHDFLPPFQKLWYRTDGGPGGEGQKSKISKFLISLRGTMWVGGQLPMDGLAVFLLLLFSFLPSSFNESQTKDVWRGKFPERKSAREFCYELK